MFACTNEPAHAKGMMYVRLQIRRARSCEMCVLLSNQITPQHVIKELLNFARRKHLTNVGLIAPKEHGNRRWCKSPSIIKKPRIDKETLVVNPTGRMLTRSFIGKIKVGHAINYEARDSPE